MIYPESASAMVKLIENSGNLAPHFFFLHRSLCFHCILSPGLGGNKSEADKCQRNGNLKSISWTFLNG